MRDILADGGDWIEVRGAKKHVQGYLKEFLFEPTLIDAKIGTLSGGERSRLLLAREFARASNLLVLDEPTNDLDMETLDLLQELVTGYSGTVLLVSHDRDFLDRTVTSVVAPEGGGRWIEYAGGYTDMLAQRGSSRFADRRADDRPQAGKAATRSDAGEAAPKAAQKLSFKQKFALESLPAKIEALSASISAMEDRIADPAFYTRDPGGFQQTITALEKARGTLQSMEEEWLELEMLRETLEG